MPQAMLELTSLEPESAQGDAGTLKSDGGRANGKEQQQAGNVQDSGFDVYSLEQAAQLLLSRQL